MLCLCSLTASATCSKGVVYCPRDWLGNLIDDHDCERDWMKNFLVGASMGYSDLQGSLRQQIAFGGLPDAYTSNIVRDYSDSGFIMGLLVGYQGIRDKWLMGVELNGDWNQIDTNHPYAFVDAPEVAGWNAMVRYERDLLAGLSARVGYFLAYNFMPYARLGAEVSRDQLETVFAPNPAVIPGRTTLDARIWVYRFLLGLGVEISTACRPLTVRVEYNYHSKGKTIETNGAIIDGVLNPVLNSNMQPTEQSASLALVWNFI